MNLWRERSIHTRRRIVALAGAVVVVVLLIVVAVPNLPCAFPGGEACAPDDDAAELVPADALAYLHANLDRDTEQYAHAADAAEELAVVGAQAASLALARIPGDALTPTAFDERVRPWFGGELAVATLPGDPPEQVVLLEAEDADGAREYAESIAAGVPEADDYRDVELREDRRGVASAEVDGFLVLGGATGVRAVIDVASGAEGAEDLSSEPVAGGLRDELPEHRVAVGYLSQAGAEELAGDRRGPLASFSAFVAPGATGGVAAAIGATEEGELELAVRSELDPELAEAQPPFFAAFERFRPTLAERLPAGALAYAGLGDPAATVEELLAQAAAQAPGITAGFEDLVRRLRRDAGVDLEEELLGSLGGEGAFALVPGEEESAPYAEFVADGIDEDAAREGLAALLAQGEGVSEQRIGEIDARSVSISPAVELTYAVFEGLAAVATDPAGIEALAEEPDDDGLAGSDSYQRATEDLGEGGDEVSMRAYLDLAGLVELAEALGLAEDPVYAGLAGEFRRLEALGLSVSADDELVATDARLLLGD